MMEMMILSLFHMAIVYQVSCNPILNVSGCIGPGVTMTCNADNFPSTTLRWFFNGEDVVAIYSLNPIDDYPIRIPSMSNVVIEILAASLASNRFQASFLSSMMVSNLSALQEEGVNSISCGDFGGKSNAISVSEFYNKGPSSPVNISVQSSYNASAHALSITWNEAQNSVQSNLCPLDEGRVSQAIVILENAESIVLCSIVNTQMHCKNGNCSFFVSLMQSVENYTLSIMAQNVFGNSNRSFFPYPIAGSSDFYLTYYFIPTNNSCSGLALCSSQRSEINLLCTVQYSTNDLLSRLNSPIRGAFNFPFSIPVLQAHTVYYYQVSMVVGELFSVTLHGTQITIDCDQDNEKIIIQNCSCQAGFFVTFSLLLLSIIVFTAVLVGFLILYKKKTTGLNLKKADGTSNKVSSVCETKVAAKAKNTVYYDLVDSTGVRVTSNEPQTVTTKNAAYNVSTSVRAASSKPKTTKNAAYNVLTTIFKH